jgi:hypothetical protein
MSYLAIGVNLNAKLETCFSVLRLKVAGLAAIETVVSAILAQSDIVCAMA